MNKLMNKFWCWIYSHNGVRLQLTVVEKVLVLVYFLVIVLSAGGIAIAKLVWHDELALFRFISLGLLSCCLAYDLIAKDLSRQLKKR